MKKKTTKTRKTNKSKSLSEATGFNNILIERMDVVLGVTLIIFSIFVLWAFASYLISGAADQSLLEAPRAGDFQNETRAFQNACGSLGAKLSFWMMSRGIGISAFLLPVFGILCGLRLCRAWKVNLAKWFFGLAVVAVWLSVAASKFLTPLLGSSHFDLGGDHGAFCVNQIENVAGEPGLVALLAIVALITLILVSRETINIIIKILNPQLVFKKIPLSVTNLTSHTGKEEQKAAVVEIPSQDAVTTIDTTEMVLPVPEKQDKKPEEKTKTDEKPQADNESNTLTVEKGIEEETAKNKRLHEEIDLSKPINPRKPFEKYKFPELSLLKVYDNEKVPQVDMEEIRANNAKIVQVLNSFGVSIKEIKATVGPTVTLFEITPADGVRISRIRNLQDDIALSLAALGIRIIAPIPGKGTIGIEVPNKKAQIVSMHSILDTRKYQETKMALPIAMGKTITNEVFMLDLATIPHLLVAGATGQGKSVGLNCILTSLLYKKHPNELKIVLVDPKQVEFSIYEPIVNHFMAVVDPDEDAIITNPDKVVRTLNSLCELMDDRYRLLKEAGVRNIKEYNDKYINHKLIPTDTVPHEFMPYIVIIIDEFGDLIMTSGKEVELPIARIAQKARAVGMHMIIATQRPTTNIITGTIKANFPGRMAFRVASQIDSRTILDRPGAEQLVGRGDMLVLSGNDPVRVQCAFVDTPEVERINEYISSQIGPVAPLELPEPKTEEGGSVGAGGSNMSNVDAIFEDAARVVVAKQQGSTSMIQRQFSIGFNRAGRLMDQLEAAGIVGPTMGAKPREVLIQDMNTLEGLFQRLKGQIQE